MSKALFISPHPDDIAFSCLVAGHSRIQVKHLLTIFGKSCYGFNTSKNDIEMVTLIRKNEDILFADLIHAKLHFWELEDSSITYIKDTYKGSLCINIEFKEALKSMIFNNSYTHIFFPAGLGWHYDHIAVSDMVFKYIIPLFHHSVRFIAYEDLPYTIELTEADINNRIHKLTKKGYIRNVVRRKITGLSAEMQLEAMRIYMSQYDEKEIFTTLKYKLINNKLNENLWIIEAI